MFQSRPVKSITLKELNKLDKKQFKRKTDSFYAFSVHEAVVDYRLYKFGNILTALLVLLISKTTRLTETTHWPQHISKVM